MNRFCHWFIIAGGLLLGTYAGSGALYADDYNTFDPLIDVCDLIEKNYVAEAETNDLVTAAINGMLHELDPYSEYIPAKDLEEFEKRTSGSYEGVGLGIDIVNNYLTVISPFEDSPADKAGIQSGDIILEVNGQSTRGWSNTRAVQELSGQTDTQVTLTILHKDDTEEKLTLTRQKITMRTVRGWRRSRADGQWDYMLDAAARIGYVRITQFSNETLADFDQAVKQLRQNGMQAMIMDLRSNPGGLMSEAVGIIDRLIDHGIIVSTRGAHTKEEVQYAHAEGTYPRFHLVVLINLGSASASEIVAGSLQDHGRAVIVGERSWGKGSVQRIFHLYNSEAAVKLTTDYYYLPKGRCVHKRKGSDTWGVEPDVKIEMKLDNIDKLRELSKELDTAALSRRGTEKNAAENPPSPEQLAAQEKQTQTDLATRLLAQDNQLDQAVKQCQGLLRVRSVLAGLAESFEAGKPADANTPESDNLKDKP